MREPLVTPTIDMLMERVYRHYPRGLEPDESDLENLPYKTSAESRRLACVHEAAAIACNKPFFPVPDDERIAIDPEVQQVVDSLRAWNAFGERCRVAFPGQVVRDESQIFFDPGYRYSVAQPGWAPPARIPPDTSDPVVCMVSVLAPVFAIYTYVWAPDEFTQIRYSNFPLRYHDRIAKLSALAEDTFGFVRIGEELLLSVVPDVVPFVSNRVMGEATLMDCLFTSCP